MTSGLDGVGGDSFWIKVIVGGVYYVRRGVVKGYEDGREGKKRGRPFVQQRCSSIAAVLYNSSGSVVEPQCLDYQSKHEILGC